MIIWTKLSIYLPVTVGSRSTITVLRTSCPLSVSLKIVSYAFSYVRWLAFLMDGDRTPSFPIPCSSKYNSQSWFPIWQPACPIWSEMHSRPWRNMKLIRFIRSRTANENNTWSYMSCPTTNDLLQSFHCAVMFITSQIRQSNSNNNVEPSSKKWKSGYWDVSEVYPNNNYSMFVRTAEEQFPHPRERPLN